MNNSPWFWNIFRMLLGSGRGCLVCLWYCCLLLAWAMVMVPFREQASEKRWDCSGLNHVVRRVYLSGSWTFLNRGPAVDLWCCSRTTSWKWNISFGKIESNRMGNEEIEAWADGVIIGAWRDLQTKPELRCNAPGSGVYRISGWGGTNAFIKKWAKPCFSIFLVTMDDFFSDQMGHSRIPLLCPGIDGESRVSDNLCLTRFLGEALEGGAWCSSIKGEANGE